jgi:hypothetical protein
MAARNLLMLMLSFAASGCTIVRIEGADARVRLVPGIVKVRPADPQTIIVVESKGFGVVPQQRAFVLGFASETAAYVDGSSRCAVILFRPEQRQVDALTQILAKANVANATICDAAPRQPSKGEDNP